MKEKNFPTRNRVKVRGTKTATAGVNGYLCLEARPVNGFQRRKTIYDLFSL